MKPGNELQKERTVDRLNFFSQQIYEKKLYSNTVFGLGWPQQKFEHICKENIMGNPLQDQLLKAGLVNKKQAGKAKRDQYVSHKKKKTTKKQKNKGKIVSELSSQVRREQDALAERNRQLNRQRAEKKQQKELKAQIRQLIEKNRVKRDEKGDPYYFAVEKIINRIFVSEEMADQLCDGQMAVVRLGKNFEVVPGKVAEQIANRSPETVVAFHRE